MLLGSNIIIVLYVFYLRKRILPKYYLSILRQSKNITLKILEKEMQPNDLLIGGIIGLPTSIILGVTLKKIYILYPSILLALVSIIFILKGLNNYRKNIHSTL